MGKKLGRLCGYFRIEHAVLLVPIFGFALYDSVFSAFSSILAVLAEEYPDVPQTAIQMILSIPPMVSVPGSLLAGFLSAYVRKKVIAEAALVVVFVGGMIPVIFPNPTIYAMFACSACIGLGQGLLHPMANAFICQVWDGDERSRVLGFKQGFNFIGEALVALCVGFLALSHWGNAFLVYLGVVPVLLFAHFVLPRGDFDKRLIGRKSKAEGLKNLFTFDTTYLFGLFFFAMAFLYGFHTNVAFLMQERGLGDTAAVSMVGSAISLTSFATGIAYGKVSRILKERTLIFGFCCLATGMLLISVLGHSFAVVVAGGVLFGVGSGIQQVSTIHRLSEAVDSKLLTIAISVCVSFVSLGAAVSPMLINGVQIVLFGAESAPVSLVVAGVGFLILVVVELLFLRKRKEVKVRGERA